MKQRMIPCNHRTFAYMKREAAPCEDRANLTIKARKESIKEKEQAHSAAPAPAVTEVSNPLTFFANPLGQSHLWGNFLAILTIVMHVGPNPHVIPLYAHVYQKVYVSTVKVENPNRLAHHKVELNQG